MGCSESIYSLVMGLGQCMLVSTTLKCFRPLLELGLEQSLVLQCSQDLVYRGPIVSYRTSVGRQSASKSVMLTHRSESRMKNGLWGPLKFRFESPSGAARH